MKEILNFGIRLMVISLVAALLLAGTNLLTEQPISMQKEKKANAAREAVMPGAGAFTLVYEAPENTKTGVISAHQCDKGSVLVVREQGYGSSGITVTVGILNDGTISQVRIDAAGETAGLGAKAGTEAYYGKYSGLGFEAVASVDAITGATKTSDACKRAVQSAIDYYQSAIKGGAGA